MEYNNYFNLKKATCETVSQRRILDKKNIPMICGHGDEKVGYS